MKKSEIITQIKRLASENKGKPPGVAKFISETGIKKSKWYPILWLRWGDALKEAGFKPNSKNVAYDKEVLIKKYIELIEKLGHPPLDGEIRVLKKSDSTLPSHNAFRKLGSKYVRVKEVLQYNKEKLVPELVINICEEFLQQGNYDHEDILEETSDIGFVYLIKHGSRNEYKIGKTINPLRREGEIRIQLPEKIKPVHYIETDDPTGIELYWHRRFQTKRKEGEWFELNKSDVNSFKKWKKII